MKPDFGGAFDPSFGGRPAHMSAVDFILWQRFKVRFPLPFERVYFDVAVGPGAPGGPGVEQKVLDAWTRITRQRVDVVGELPASWTLVEVRGNAGPGALGSLVVYRNLWQEDPPDPRALTLWLVTDAFPEALVPSLAREGIQLFVV